MKGHNIGKGATLLLTFVKQLNEQHEDVDLFYAPSECHELVNRGAKRRYRLLRRQIQAVTDLKFKQFEKELERRTSRRWVHFNLIFPF